MARNKIIIFLILIFQSLSTISNGKINSCMLPECNQFDFWIGKWNASYGDTGAATNTITKNFDGFVIEEHFEDPGQSFTGQSWSVYVPSTKKWHQTWVDNQGGYIVLSGEFKDDKMMLFTEPVKTPEGKFKQNRMIYYNITKESFDWSWEMSEDEGKTWVVKWLIHYKRGSR